VDANPPGTRFCLSETFKITQTIRPKVGNAFVGPAVLDGEGPLIRDDGINFYGIEGKGVSNLRYEMLEVKDFEIGLRPGPGAVVIDNYVHHNVRTGVGCGQCDGHQLIGNELAYNGSGEHLGSGAAGYKTVSNNLLVRGNYVHDNIGNGIWFDLDALNVLVENNVSERNVRKGIFYEVSSGSAVIRNNLVRFNNCAVVIAGCSPQSAGSPGGGIATNSSKNVEIYGNVLGGNAVAGINFRDDAREHAPPFNISVYDNQMNGDALLNCRSEWSIVCKNNS
jgi:hypothetical protein